MVITSKKHTLRALSIHKDLNRYCRYIIKFSGDTSGLEALVHRLRDEATASPQLERIEVKP